MKVSKMVIDRQKSSRKVSAAARTHREKAVSGVSELLGEAHGTAAGQLMDASADTLDAATYTMVGADEAHIAELGDDAGGRERRDMAASVVREEVVALRSLTTVMFGTAYIVALGYEGDTPEDPVMLLRLAERILERLGTVEIPEPKYEGMSFDAEQWKAKLTAPTGDLRAAIDEIATEQREAEQTLTAKQEAMASYDEVFSKTAGLISALLGIAGEEALASRVRPAKSRPGRIADSDDTIEESVVVS